MDGLRPGWVIIQNNNLRFRGHQTQLSNTANRTASTYHEGLVIASRPFLPSSVCMSTPIHVIGIGLSGATSLPDSTQHLIDQATLLVGSDRHLSYFPDHKGDRLVLGDIQQAIEQIHSILVPPAPLAPPPQIAILTSGDPLFFGLGRLLLEAFSPDQITFHPHLSAIQLAFSRVKVPWQDAQMISVHGRSLEQLTAVLQQGAEKIAVLTDQIHTPQAIARHLIGLDLPSHYHLWVCENLGSLAERVQSFGVGELQQWEQEFALLNVVILLRDRSSLNSPPLDSLPLLGIPDSQFLSFVDRPGLMTKREVRILVLGELALQPSQVVWDIGAGTGSVSIEVARLCPSSQVYAIEQTAAGITLIQKNSQQFQVQNVIAIQGKAPAGLEALPAPDRVFIGGSSGKLPEILDLCRQKLCPSGKIVLALATLEHLTLAMSWVQAQPCGSWEHRLLQVQLSRSVPIANLTRFNPLNPVTLVTLVKT